MSIMGEMIFFCDKEFTTCEGYEIDKIEDFLNVLKAIEKTDKLAKE